MITYKVEVVSIEGGRDVIQYHETKTKNAAIKLATKLSKKHNVKGVNSEGWQSQQSVWVDIQEDYNTIEHYQFIDGVKAYYSNVLQGG
jgi:hypothetical protein